MWPLAVAAVRESDALCPDSRCRVTLVIATFDPITQNRPERSSKEAGKTMGAATRVLRQEHQSIREVLNFTEGVVVRIERGEKALPEVLAKVADYLRRFVDQCHHHKEEDVFFPTLERKGVHTFGGPLGVMLMEHERARGLIQEINEAAAGYKAGDEASGKTWARAAWDYSGLMQEHFGKEEEVLFRMADNIMGPEEQAAVAADFERLESEKIGPAGRLELEAMMKELIAHNGRR